MGRELSGERESESDHSSEPKGLERGSKRRGRCSSPKGITSISDNKNSFISCVSPYFYAMLRATQLIAYLLQLYHKKKLCQKERAFARAYQSSNENARKEP